MNNLARVSRLQSHRGICMSVARLGDELGSGAGKGGGGGGSIREAGGAFGKKEAAVEEQYFRKLQADQLSQLKNHVEDEVSFHEEQIKKHTAALEEAKKHLGNLK